jgi:hypothetical protein
MQTPKIKSEEWEERFDAGFLRETGYEGDVEDIPNYFFIKSFISSIIKEREEAIIKILDEDIYIAKTRKRITPFQDTLFNFINITFTINDCSSIFTNSSNSRFT